MAVKVALDPYMFRRVPLTDLPGLVADLGYSYIELSPREDFLPFFVHPRADKAQIAAFSRALSAAPSPKWTSTASHASASSPGRNEPANPPPTIWNRSASTWRNTAGRRGNGRATPGWVPRNAVEHTAHPAPAPRGRVSG
jgi:hypothetical protein